MRNLIGLRTLLFSALLLSMLLLVLPSAAFGQFALSVTLAPPEIPVYEQPICPTDGYLWTPGYWGYGDDGYYWVSGDWIQPPEVGFLWTPGYWGWGGNAYAFHEGYWGQNVGFYGGINYGFGYGGRGYEGGRWDGGHFSYNTSVNRVDVNVIHNTYNTRVVENNTRVSFNGGTGGVEARATVQEEAAGRERHVAPVAAQTSHVAAARANPELRASANNGHPSAEAVAKSQTMAKPEAANEREAAKPETAAKPEAANERAAAPAAKETEKEGAASDVKKPEEKPAVEAKPSAHASEIPAHKATTPNTGNPKTDQKYQQQQNSLATKQNQDHQKLAQQQEKEHQQLTKSNASEGQKQQVEQKHQQQTQQLEQKHAAQTQKAQPHQQPAKPAESKPTDRPH
jgi:YXWGXW repeat-containing protein